MGKIGAEEGWRKSGGILNGEGHLRDIWRAGRGSKGLGNQGLGETGGGGKKNGGQWRVYNNL